MLGYQESLLHLSMHPHDPRSKIQLLKVLCLLGFLFVVTNDATTFTSIEFCPVSFPNGTTVCAMDTTSQVTTNDTRTECALECLVPSSRVRCVAFNYNSTSQKCEVYNSLPSQYANSSDCINYQQPGHSYQGFPTVDNVTTNCSFPYTYNRQLYYQCVQTVRDPANLCNKFACLTSNWTLAVCPPPANYSVRNATESFPVEICGEYGLSVLCGSGMSSTEVDVTTTSFNNWMVIHQNLNSGFNWNLEWAKYKLGFGSSSSDYWMGLAVLSQMTSTQDYRLRIELFDPTKGWYSIEYSFFKIDPEQTTTTTTTSFALHLPPGGGTGDVTDAFLQHNGMKFTTTDKNNLPSGGGSSNCASANGAGGWWYNSCNGGAFLTASSMKWISTPYEYLQLQTSRMMIKAV